MKKLLMVATVVAVAAFVMMGCSMLFGKTYVLSLGTLACMEVTTNDLELQAELENNSFAEGTCSTTNAVGSCTLTETSASSGTYSLEMFYYDTYYTATEAQADCESSSGNWSAM